MRNKLGVPALLALLFGLSAVALEAQQTGTLAGVVTDAETGAPLQDVAVEILGLGDTQAGGIFSNASGQFRLTLPAGTYSVVFSLLGYETKRVDGVRVQAGQVEALQVELTSRAYLLNPLVVTASRRVEKALDAPAHVDVVSSEMIRERAAMTPVEHVRALPGVDIAQTGISQSNVVTRGFNNVFSGALLVLTDNRYAHVPSLRFNAYNMLATTDLDIDRIEISLGPGAALYGPNAASGVMHIITKSPIDDPGSSAFMASGLRAGNNVNSASGSLFQGGFRVAHRVSDRVGFKVSGQFFQGDDWEFVDPLEAAAKAAAEQAGSPLADKIGNRDFRSKRYGGEARLDIRPDEDSELIFDVGWNTLASSIELTGLGAGQVDGWVYRYFQTRYRRGRLFTQFFLNQSDAGDT